MKRTYNKPTAQLFSVNASGFIASGGGCYMDENTKWYGGDTYWSEGQWIKAYCWKWVGSESFPV